uniref:Uncharacterized protein n=1 Tax=uncultured Armatimonadetes bacterium TaxID=157466 RepID=A0A6J4H6P0_9BACT|nr:hypothetical protein AVDCRST_MAG63-197 [uncultured Armatimonadetes bacterium]
MLHRPAARPRDGGELLGVDVALDPVQRRDGVLVPGREADAPPGHVEGFRQRVRLDGDIQGTRRLQDRRRPIAVVADLGVGAVLADEQVELAREAHGFCEKFRGRHGARRVVRVVQEQELCLARHVGGDRRQVGQPLVLGRERHQVRRAPREQRVDLRHGVGRVGHEGDVAGVDVAPAQVRQPLLGADELEQFGLGVQRNAEARSEPAGAGFQERRVPGGALVVAVRFGVAGRFAEFGEDRGRGGLVGVADAQVDQVTARGDRFGFQASDLAEQVGGDQVKSFRTLQRDTPSEKFAGRRFRHRYTVGLFGLASGR